MTAAEAKKMIVRNPDSPDALYANGYLEALSGPEVKVLVEALEMIMATRYPPDAYIHIAKEALAKFKDAEIVARIKELHEKESLREKIDFQLQAERERSKALVEALDRIRTIDAPVFNGEKITTINPYSLSRWQKIAEEALAAYREKVKP